MNTLKFCIVFCFSSCIYAQELQGTVTINSESIGQTNQQEQPHVPTLTKTQDTSCHPR
mgnify:CR=1 FL=1